MLKKIAGVGLVSVAPVTSVLAAVPADVTAAFGDLVTDGGTFMTAVWGIVTIFTVGFIWIKLFKKGTNKAT